MQIVGLAQERAALAAQLETRFRYLPDSILSGSMGRAAIYGSFPDVPSPDLTLRRAEDPSELRDLDFLFLDFPELEKAKSELSSKDSAHFYGPHMADYLMIAFVERENDGRYYVFADDNTPNGRPLEVRPEVFKPVQRELVGVHVATLTVGAQLKLGEMAQAVSPTARHSESQDAFAAFASEVQAAGHTEEFLPDHYFEPFDEVIASYRQPALVA